MKDGDRQSLRGWNGAMALRKPSGEGSTRRREGAKMSGTLLRGFAPSRETEARAIPRAPSRARHQRDVFIPLPTRNFLVGFWLRWALNRKTMNEDAELLGRYAGEKSEAAFAELVRRHLDLTYSTALRLVHGDTHRAEDVTQQVFAELARQARRLSTHPALVGWLYTTTRLTAQRVIRTELRRAARERETVSMHEIQSNAEPNWDQLKPILENAMYQLGEQDRLAVLLRFFQN